MKKLLAILLTLAVMATLTLVPAMAEEAPEPPAAEEQAPAGTPEDKPEDKPEEQPAENEQPARGQQPNGNGSRGNMTPNFGRNGQNGQQPAQGQQPNGNGSRGNMTPNYGRNGQNAQQPARGQQPNGNGPHGGKDDHRMARIDFDAMVQDGVISQETRDKIDTYMKEHAPANGAQPEAPTDGEQPEAPADGEAPAQPEAPADGAQPDLLKDLLDDGVISQEEYDAIAAWQSSAK